MFPDADSIAQLVIDQFESLPRKRKPAVRTSDIHEWVPLSGIVAEQNGTLRCLCLATGMKCLPVSKLPEAKGNGIHDWHAEILALRAFNHLLLQECQRLLAHDMESDIIRQRGQSELDFEVNGQPFGLREDITLYMYCSEAPCGDASMELTISAQEDPTPWDFPKHLSLPGRQYFSQLGITRRKPSRTDAPPTLSKSCSDKLALKQCTSLLSSVTSLLVSPRHAYLRALVLPVSQYDPIAFQRCFSSGGRMADVAKRSWTGGYGFHEMSFMTTNREFTYSKRSVAERVERGVACNLAVSWSYLGTDEALIGGVLQGKKAFRYEGASVLSRRRMWSLAKSVAAEAEFDCPQITYIKGEHLRGGWYGDLKNGILLSTRLKVKEDVKAKALHPWPKNIGDDEFNLKEP